MNIILIVVDTLRADHLGCYGYPFATSPYIDKIASEGTRATRCYAPAIPTTPAHATIYTGCHPLRHNIVCHGGQVDLDRRLPVLPELLQQGGYTTAAVDNLYDIKNWFARGYEFYINPSFRHKLRLLVSCDEINRRAIPWLRAHSTEKFFLFVHYWEPHAPYLPPDRFRKFYPSGSSPFTSPDSMEPLRKQPIWGMFHDIWFGKLGPIKDVDYVSSLYDGEIAHVDEGIEQLLGALDKTGVSEDTLVVITGDHGESLTEHDIYFDHHGLYEPTIRVPLIMKLPHAIPAGKTAEPMCQHLDIAPTLLQAAQIPIPDSMDGKSLWPRYTGKSDTGGWEEILSCENTWQSKWSLRTETRKLILSRRPDRHGMPPRELYDLVNDPLELKNLAEESLSETEELTERLESRIREGLLRAGRNEDPLVTQPISLGQKWDDWVKLGAEKG